MEIKTDGRAAQGPPSGQSEQQLTAVRQGRWLYELEQALLARSDKKPAADERPPEHASGEAPKPELGGGDSRDLGGAVAHVATAADADGTRPAAAAAGTRANAGPSALAADAAPAAAARGVRAPAASAAADLLPPGVALASAATQVAAPPPGNPLAAYAAAGAGGQRTISEATAGGIQLVPERAPVTAALGWTLPPVGEGAAPMPEPVRTEAEEAPHSAREAPDQEAARDYAERLLHIYQDAGGIQAWVRDAGLGAAQSLLLARGMADELSNTGSRLVELTVNGKKILSASDRQVINSKGAV